MISWVKKDARTIPNILFITELTELYHFFELQESYRIKPYSTPFDRCAEQVEWNQNTWFTNVWQAVCQKISYRFKNKMMCSFFKNSGHFQATKTRVYDYQIQRNSMNLNCSAASSWIIRYLLDHLAFPLKFSKRNITPLDHTYPYFLRRDSSRGQSSLTNLHSTCFKWFMCIYRPSVLSTFSLFEQISRFNWSHV